MITITDTDEIHGAYDLATKHQGAYATCRVLDRHAPWSEEWAERCEIAGVPACIYYLFEPEEADVENACDMPWDAEHASKIEIAEQDENGEYETLWNYDCH